MPSTATGRSDTLVKPREEYVLKRFWRRMIFSPCVAFMMMRGKEGSPRKAARLLFVR